MATTTSGGGGLTASSSAAAATAAAAADADDAAAHKNRPKLTAFRQQRLRAWQPILTPCPVISFFLLVGIVFVPIGAILLVASDGVYERAYRYDHLTNCRLCDPAPAADPSAAPRCSTLYDDGRQCQVTIDIDSDAPLQPPIYIYYQLDNYYQNHRRYVKSRSDKQLRGETVTYADVRTACEPIVSFNESTSDSDVYLPCGLIAASFFNDSFSLSRANGAAVPLRKKGIAWPSDVDYKFGNPETPVGRPLPYAAGGPLGNFTLADEDFIVWMRTAGLPDFRKLYRIVDSELAPGQYTFNISNHYPVWQFGGKKSIVVSTSSWVGGRNPFLGYAYVIVGAVCLLQGLVFLVRHLVAPRRLGDLSFLRWQN